MSRMPGDQPPMRVAGEERLPGLQLSNVVLRNRRDLVLDHARLGVLPGSVTALWGDEHSGVSALLHVAAGLVRPVSGTVQVAGVSVPDEPARARALTGWVPASRQDLGAVTPRELLRAFAAGHRLPERTGRRRISELLDRLGLTADADHRSHDLSLAGHTRLLLGCALMHSPEVLLLDQPFAGLDSRDREQIGDVLRGEANGGTAVLASATDPFLLEAVCDRSVKMAAGRIVSSHEYGHAEAGRLWRIVSLDGERLRSALRDHGVGFEDVPAPGQQWSSRAAVDVAVAHEQEATALLAALARAGVPVYGFGPGSGGTTARDGAAARREPGHGIAAPGPDRDQAGTPRALPAEPEDS